MRGLDGQDDFASMGQVIARRFARLRDAADPRRYDESFASVPNLVVIDGGKGQLVGGARGDPGDRRAAARRGDRAREARGGGLRPGPARIRSCSTATTPGLQLLQRIRDEAHRFAITHHRQKRDTRAFASIFDTLEGIGPSRRRAILQHFGSADRFLAASQEELEAVPGLPAKTARSVFGQLHRTGGPASNLARCGVLGRAGAGSGSAASAA